MGRAPVLPASPFVTGPVSTSRATTTTVAAVATNVVPARPVVVARVSLAVAPTRSAKMADAVYLMVLPSLAVVAPWGATQTPAALLAAAVRNPVLVIVVSEE